MFIEILKYGDFDLAYTECSMFSALDYNMKDLLTEFADEYSINPNAKVESEMIGKIEYSNDGQLRISAEGISNIRNDEYDGVADMFIEFLKKKGFNKLSTNSVIFSD